MPRPWPARASPLYDEATPPQLSPGYRALRCPSWFTYLVLGGLAMLLVTYVLTLTLRPRRGARVGGTLGKGSFFIETKD
jgi:hypothetical protein